MSDTVMTTERMWDPETESLVYRAGEEIPTAEHERLIGETEMVARRITAPEYAPYNATAEPAEDVAEEPAPVKKTAAKKAARRKPHA